MNPVPKAPPAGIVRIADRVRRGLGGAQRRMAPPHITLLNTVMGRWLPEALGALARLGVPQALADGPRSADDLANELGLHPGALYRLLRALARDGWLDENDHRFGLTPWTRPLLPDAPDSIRNIVLEVTAPRNTTLWSELPRAVTTGDPVFSEVHGEADLWALLDARPEDHAIFHGAMAEFTRDGAPAYARSLDFSRFPKVVDLGGGTGTLLATILALHPVSGVLVDSESVLEGAPATLAQWGVQDRVELVPGDITRAIPAGGDAYLAKAIVHGFSDADAVALLKRWRSAFSAHAKLVLVEVVVPESGPYLHYLDLHMLLGSGGRERTRAEFAALLGEAGFRLESVHATATPMDLIVAAPA